MSVDTIVAVLAIGGGAITIAKLVPQFVSPELESYAVLLASVLWAALVLGLWKRWQDSK